ncbi:MAG: SET domain-containing protein-lysine N-methyltransferase [Leptonema sp. (in: Bacteria)]|nr:SET domain-containing protein-lysine N-methyltransferase [Leptonema sp. (in: bacteria)]
MNKKLKSNTKTKTNQKLNDKTSKKQTQKTDKKEIVLQPQPEFTAKSNKAIEDKILVKKSKIHGKGCFAKKKIRKGAYLGSYEGITVLDDNTYVLWVQQDHGGWHLIDGKNNLRYVNHSLTPNAEWDGNKLYSLRTIEEDEEITFHYGEDWEDHP